MHKKWDNGKKHAFENTTYYFEPLDWGGWSKCKFYNFQLWIENQQDLGCKMSKKFIYPSFEPNYTWWIVAYALDWILTWDFCKK
jgi:hypothetical protein